MPAFATRSAHAPACRARPEQAQDEQAASQQTERGHAAAAAAIRHVRIGPGAHLVSVADAIAVGVGEGWIAARVLDGDEETRVRLEGIGQPVAVAITCSDTGGSDDEAIDNPLIDTGNWVALDYGAVTGAVSHLTVTICGTRRVVE